MQFLVTIHDNKTSESDTFSYSGVSLDTLKTMLDRCYPSPRYTIVSIRVLQGNHRFTALQAMGII